jgi:UDP-2-acetamido-3-amino-2,3-dideoxy-glucuronate N-acetyltransferase
MATFVHASSFVDEGAVLGDGTKVWHFCHILKNTRIGANCIFGQNCMVGPNVTIGDRVKVQNNVSIYDGVVLEDDVFCAPSMVFTNVINPRGFIERKQEFRKTLVKRGATLGANSTVVCGNTVGRYALVGAGAVVVADVPDYALMLGVPAKRKGWVCKCGVTLTGAQDGQEIACSECSSIYKPTGETLAVIKETL